MLCDAETEAEVVRILWAEATTFGAAHGKRLLEMTSLTPTDFTDLSSRLLFEGIASQVAQGFVPSRANVWPLMAKTLGPDADWGLVLESIHGKIANPSHLSSLAAKLRELYVRRGVNGAAHDLLKHVEDPEFSDADLIAEMVGAAHDIPLRKASWITGTEALERESGKLADRVDGFAACVPSGFRALDELTGGFPPTLVVVAALPGVGKSAFWAGCVKSFAERGTVSATFSLEDRAEWLVWRLLARESGVPQFVLRYRALGGDQPAAVNDAVARMGYMGRVLVDDRPMLRPREILSAARLAVMQKGAKIIGLDNMTAVAFARGPRMDLEIQDFLTEARALADELKTPFVVFSHVRRREGLNDGDMPRLTDCAETSAFEKLARVAYGLARKQDDTTLRVRVLKNTNGIAGKQVELPFHAPAAIAEDAALIPMQNGLPL